MLEVVGPFSPAVTVIVGFRFAESSALKTGVSEPRVTATGVASRWRRASSYHSLWSGAGGEAAH